MVWSHSPPPFPVARPDPYPPVHGPLWNREKPWKEESSVVCKDRGRRREGKDTHCHCFRSERVRGKGFLVSFLLLPVMRFPSPYIHTFINPSALASIRLPRRARHSFFRHFSPTYSQTQPIHTYRQHKHEHYQVHGWEPRPLSSIFKPTGILEFSGREEGVGRRLVDGLGQKRDRERGAHTS